MRQSKLKSVLAFLMIKVSMYSTLIFFSVFFTYTWVSVHLLGNRDLSNEINITGSDWLQICLMIFLSLIASIAMALNFSKQLLSPIISLVETTKKIANGELSARANAGKIQIIETAELINNFNSMAERLETSSGEIKTWNAAIAHELRTPITILHGRLQGLADGLFKPEKALFINLLKQTDGLSRLIEDLRTISLADSGYLSLKKECVNIYDEIKAVTEIITPALKEKNITAILRLADVFVLCDAVRIRQVMLALLDNSCRYASAGVLIISCYSTENGAIITVEDEGPGVADHLQDSLFEPFRRADDSRSRECGGSGLGLAVVKSIINAHNGTVNYYQSNLGGAGFIINLPLICAL